MNDPRSIDKRELLLASLDKQHLLAPAAMRDVVSNLCGLQAQFANNPGHALRVRAHDFSPGGWRDGLVKTWTFRRTMHVVRRDELGLFLSAQGVPDKWDDNWGVSRRLKPSLSKSLLEWMRGGEGGRETLKARCRAKGIDAAVLENVFHGWGGLLKEMCQRGMAAYAPGTEKLFIACDDVGLMERDAARAVVLERYFRNLGPATLDDCAVFTGFTKKDIREIVQKRALPLKSVWCEGVEYWYIGEWDASRDIPGCLFLAGFDQLIMAYKDRSRLVAERHRSALVTDTGIVHPTVLVDGRLRAKWKLDGRTLRITPFERLGQRVRRRIDRCGLQVFGDAVREVAFSG